MDWTKVMVKGKFNYKIRPFKIEAFSCHDLNGVHSLFLRSFIIRGPVVVSVSILQTMTGTSWDIECIYLTRTKFHPWKFLWIIQFNLINPFSFCWFGNKCAVGKKSKNWNWTELDYSPTNEVAQTIRAND